VRELLSETFLFKERGEIDIKVKGRVPTYLLKGRRTLRAA
jgi:hypothetical protein